MGGPRIDFEREVIERSRRIPVLVDFWAPWCGPCRTLTPVLDRLALQAKGRWELVKINTEEQPDLATDFGIRSIPNVKLFRGGEVVDEFLGALPEPEIRRWLSKVVPSPLSGEYAHAEALVGEGRRAEAEPVLRRILEAEPDNEAVRVLLAELVLGRQAEEAESLVSSIGLDSDLSDKAEALRTLASLIRVDSEGALPADPVAEVYRAGMGYLGIGDFDKALEAFTEVLHRNRRYAGGAAKEAGKAIFRLLGIRHPVSERHFRSFSSALNV